MTSGVIRISARSRRPCRISSWPAACGIRWVKPSSATLSPSRTRPPTASRSETISAKRLGRHGERLRARELGCVLEVDDVVVTEVLDEPILHGKQAQGLILACVEVLV